MILRIRWSLNKGSVDLDAFGAVAEELTPLLDEVQFSFLSGDMLHDAVQEKKPTAGSLDGWGWREFKTLPVAWFDRLASILALVELEGVWPDGLLDAYIAMIPQADGDSTLLGQRPLCVLPIIYRLWASVWLVHLRGWFESWVPASVLSAGGGRSSVDAWDLEESLSGVLDSDVRIFVADVVKSFDTVDRGILGYFLSRLGLPGWFWHHVRVRLRFKLSCGLGEAWTRDGGIPEGCPLSMIFIVALYLPWCGQLESFLGVEPQIYADNLKCVSSDDDDLLEAARFTNTYIRLVGQARAPSKCVLLSTSALVRGPMKEWVLSDAGDKWTVKLDVRDLGGHSDTTYRRRAATLAGRVLKLLLQFSWSWLRLLVSLASSRFCELSFLRGALHAVEDSGSPLTFCRNLGRRLSLLFGPRKCRWLTLVLSCLCWTVHLDVTLGFMWSGVGLRFFVGILHIALWRYQGCIPCSVWLLGVVLGMVLCICW